MGNLQSFRAALERLAPRHKDQAKELEIPIRTLTEYKAGRLPKLVRRLMQHPDLLEGLLDDARAGRTNGQH